MEFLKIVRRRSFLNESIYIALNIGLAVALMYTIKVTGSLLPAFGLVLISMWRIFAVRPRFWFANIQTNLVSVIVSVSYVVLLYIANNITNLNNQQITIIQAVAAVIYVAWLLYLKPRSKKIYVVSQAGVGLFVGITAIFSITYGWIATPVILLAWLVGYATARHVLGNYDDESHTQMLSLVWGLFVAEISWVAYHWTFAYKLPIVSSILLPQASIIILCVGFLAYKSYDSYYHHQKIRFNDIVLPLLFTVGIICVLVLAFNSVGAGV